MADDQNPTTPEIQLVLQALARIDERLTRLETKVDERLHDTRPLWDALNTRLDLTDNRLDRVDARLERIEGEVGDMSRVVLSYGSLIARTRDDMHALGERVERLESERRP